MASTNRVARYAMPVIERDLLSVSSDPDGLEAALKQVLRDRDNLQGTAPRWCLCQASSVVCRFHV